MTISKDTRNADEFPELVDFAEDMARLAVTRAEAELQSPTTPKPEFTSDLTWKRQRRTSLIWAYIGLGNLLVGRNRDAEALETFDRMAALTPLETFKNEEMMENYARALVSGKRYDDAERIIEHAIRTERVTSAMKGTLRTVYLQRYGNDERYLQVVAGFEKKLMDRLKAEVKPKFVDKPSFPFTLKDLDGRAVSLSSLQGKIVILDFWATWCAPCLASFPGMQKAVDRFAGDTNVVFLFINTSEKGKDIDKRVASFVASKKYSFRVLLDGDYNVRDAYEARSIPHKFFIDQKGRIRLRTVGYSGSPDRLVDEIAAVIELLKEAS
jgi:thiol-disulfide isomerase/thioredoxin